MIPSRLKITKLIAILPAQDGCSCVLGIGKTEEINEKSGFEDMNYKYKIMRSKKMKLMRMKDSGVEFLGRCEEETRKRRGRHRLRRDGDEIHPRLPRVHHSSLP
ncbi:hypothetical protein QVD17_05013 [Tagetes erecta]|uniref:Uncharacterized protein n=1 Tax=Tagetes erecta TaxID=13708 RepID=A0AAD8LIW7_TARER|nr:hypothetical protein QVD17_05013 [Tagetes erecta]